MDLPLLLVGLAVGLVLGTVAGLLLGRSVARRDERLLAASFTGLAVQALRDTSGESRAAVGDLVAPLRDHLARVERQLHDLEVERSRTLGELREQVTSVRLSSEQVSRETASLVDALRRPQARGRWGELQLRRVVEMAGMQDRCDFVEQPTLRSSDGTVLRPDLVVRLAGGRTIVVDAKVTLAAYLEAVESPDADEAHARMAAHARHLRAHVDRLADKAYWQQLEDTPEFVVLFVPGEAFLGPALEHDPALLEHACARRVHLATPTTLVSLLRTAAYGWQQAALTDGAREVLSAGRELYARLGTLGVHVDKLGRSLSTAVTEFNRTVGSLERFVLPSARRMSELGLAQEPLPVPVQVDALARTTSAPELSAPAALPPEPAAPLALAEPPPERRTG